MRSIDLKSLYVNLSYLCYAQDKQKFKYEYEVGVTNWSP